MSKLHDGLTKKAPPVDDASRRPPSGSVNSESTRKETAHVGSAPGPRTA